MTNCNKNITRVVLTAEDKVHEPSYMIENSLDDIKEVVQNSDNKSEIIFSKDGNAVLKQKNWSLKEKDILTYKIDGEAKLVTKRTVDGERTFVENASFVKTGTAYEGKVSFSIDKDEAIYGLGQQENGKYNYRGVKVPLYQNNMMIPMPVIISSNNYALLFDANCLMTYEEQNNVMTFSFDAVNQIDYYVITGDNFDELISGIHRLTGKAEMLPEWVFGYIQSKERYKTQDEIIEAADKFRELKIPVSCIVLDWQSWEEGKWGNKVADKTRFPNLKAMIDELHSRDIYFMISIWPNANAGSLDHKQMTDAGKMLSNLSTYDAFDEEAREIYWKQCDREFFSAGTDAWWCDSSEPFTPDWNGLVKKSDDERYELAKDSLTKFLDARDANAYALYHAKGIYENQLKTSDKKRVTNLTRSGWPSVQKYGVILWSGDIKATWQTMRAQIAEGLSICASGIPFWTLDIGAFFVGSDKAWRKWSNVTEGSAPWFWQGDYEDGTLDMGYRELYVRWLQLGAFLPVMRAHGTDAEREPWHFGEPGTKYYDTIEKYIKLRYTLMPYIYSLAYKACDSSRPIMRSLMFDFASDANVKNISSQYMFGPSLLVCPVTQAMEYAPNSTPVKSDYSWEVYLPECEGWYDYETLKFYDGGKKVSVYAPIEKMPLFVKAGSIIPTKSSGGMHEIMVYEGADCAFEMYFDNGKDYSFKNGQYALISIRWDDDKKALALTNKHGAYKVPDKYSVTIVCRNGKKESKEVIYQGDNTIVTF